MFVAKKGIIEVTLINYKTKYTYHFHKTKSGLNSVEIAEKKSFSAQSGPNIEPIK